MLRGLGLGIIITACIMGSYTRSAVAKARVTVLKQYGLGGEVAEAEESSQTEESVQKESSTMQDTSERDEQVESEIQSVLDAAKEEEYEQTGEENQSAESEQQDLSESVPEESLPTNSLPEESSQEPSSNSVIVVEPSEPENNPAQTIQITVASGDDSGTVARKLYNAGIIDNAGEYDAFLMQHGYDKSINPGTKTIYTTDSWQEIAEKLTQK